MRIYVRFLESFKPEFPIKVLQIANTAINAYSFESVWHVRIKSVIVRDTIRDTSKTKKVETT